MAKALTTCCFFVKGLISTGRGQCAPALRPRRASEVRTDVIRFSLTSFDILEKQTGIYQHFIRKFSFLILTLYCFIFFLYYRLVFITKLKCYFTENSSVVCSNNWVTVIDLIIKQSDN